MKSIFLKIKLLFSLFIAKLLGFRFIWVQDEEEKKIAYRLRYDVYKDAGYIEENKHKDNELKDKYDEVSDNLLVTRRGYGVATVRVVYDSPMKFPTENLFNINLVGDRKKTIEIARLCILKDFRGKNFIFNSRLVMGAIITKLYFYSKEKNMNLWLFNMPEKLQQSFGNFGVVFFKISEDKPLKTHLEEREIIKGYFSQRRLHPYILDIDKL